MIEGVNYFIIDGKKSSDSGIILTAPPLVQIPERDVESISIPGRNGDLTIDNGRYKNITIKYSCAIIEGLPEEFGYEISRLLGYNRSAEYRRLEDTYDPKSFRTARLKSVSPLQMVGYEAGEFEVKFDCMPQRYLKSGESPISIVAGRTSVITNTTSEIAAPLIMIGPEDNDVNSGEVEIGATKLGIKNLTAGDRIIIHGEAMQSVIRKLDGTTISASDHLEMSDFPKFMPGRNNVKITGFTSIKIVPRWWTV